MVRRESSFETRNTGTGMSGCTVVSGDVRESSVRVSRFSFFLGWFGSKTVNAGELPGRTDIGDDEEPELRKTAVREEFADFDESFELREQIADGGQGLISRAVDKKLNRIVAVKTLNGTLKERSSSRNAFVAEARVTGRLDHPAVVPVHGLYSDSAGNLASGDEAGPRGYAEGVSGQNRVSVPQDAAQAGRTRRTENAPAAARDLSAGL